jgi:hypothetical protein
MLSTIFDKIFHFKKTKLMVKMARKKLLQRRSFNFPVKKKRNGKGWAGGGSGFSTPTPLCVCVCVCVCLLSVDARLRRRSHTFASAGKTFSSSFFFLPFYYVFLFI